MTRILSQMDRFHLARRGSRLPGRRRSTSRRMRRSSGEIAEQAAVLLKNEGNALPLTADDLASLAVIGPTGGQSGGLASWANAPTASNPVSMRRRPWCFRKAFITLVRPSIEPLFPFGHGLS